MANYEEIVEFTGKFSNIFTKSDYILNQLKKEATLELISQIIDKSNKSVGEVLVLFLSAIKHLWGDGDVFTALEEKDSFQAFVRANRDKIVDISIRKTLQSNLPERALPLFEIFNKKIKDTPTAVIELGASYGLIGQCLLNPAEVMKKPDRYFYPGQKIPRDPRPAGYYMGIELSPPEENWLFAGVWMPRDEMRLKHFIKDIPRDNKTFRLIEASAFGFSALEPVKKLIARPITTVVLTSFLFFQLDEEKRKKLRNEIMEFIHSTGSHWINETFKPSMSSGIDESEYFIEWNGKKIIELRDDWCSDWKWVC